MHVTSVHRRPAPDRRPAPLPDEPWGERLSPATASKPRKGQRPPVCAQLRPGDALPIDPVRRTLESDALAHLGWRAIARGAGGGPIAPLERPAK